MKFLYFIFTILISLMVIMAPYAGVLAGDDTTVTDAGTTAGDDAGSTAAPDAGTTATDA